jgi:hypothetical protein
MAKDRIDREELASKLMETATGAEDPLRAMAEVLTDFLMEAEVTAKVGAEPHKYQDLRFQARRALDAKSHSLVVLPSKFRAH